MFLIVNISIRIQRVRLLLLAGPDSDIPLSRSPPTADRYLPEWTTRNFHSGHLAETERLAAERLLQETHDLIQNAR